MMSHSFKHRLQIAFLAINRVLLMKSVSLLAIVGPKASRLQQPLLKAMGIDVKGDVFFGRRIIVYSPDRLKLGQGVAIADNAHIACHAQITIGDDFLAAPGLYLNSGQHDVLTMAGRGEPISIGNRVWCGVRVTICAGVEIGDDVVIGAGSVVIKSIPSGCVAVGVPAAVVSKIERDHRHVSRTFERKQ